MSRLRMTFSRLLALGGFTGLSGSTFAYYRYNLLEDYPKTANCRSVQLCEKKKSQLPDKKKEWDDNWDKSAQINKTVNGVKSEPEIPILDLAIENISSCPSSPPEPEPSATRHILLVRHGHYTHNNGDRFRTLTEIGRKQAILTGERLKSLQIKFNNIVVSTMTRAQETGSIIGDLLPEVATTNCSLLREGAPYPIEPKSSVWNPLDQTFFKDNPRIEGAFRKYIHRADPSQKEDSYDLLVCHANVIRYLVCRSLQFPSEGWGRMSIAHCGLTWLAIRPNGRVSLRGLGDIGHLPPDLITYH